MTLQELQQVIQGLAYRKCVLRRGGVVQLIGLGLVTVDEQGATFQIQSSGDVPAEISLNWKEVVCTPISFWTDKGDWTVFYDSAVVEEIGEMLASNTQHSQLQIRMNELSIEPMREEAVGEFREAAHSFEGKVCIYRERDYLQRVELQRIELLETEAVFHLQPLRTWPNDRDEMKGLQVSVAWEFIGLSPHEIAADYVGWQIVVDSEIVAEISSLAESGQPRRAVIGRLGELVTDRLFHLGEGRRRRWKLTDG